MRCAAPLVNEQLSGLAKSSFFHSCEDRGIVFGRVSVDKGWRMVECQPAFQRERRAVLLQCLIPPGEVQDRISLARYWSMELISQDGFGILRKVLGGVFIIESKSWLSSVSSVARG